MAAKIEAARNAVRPGTKCAACVIAAGSDFNSIRSILLHEFNPEFGPSKGTLFATPGSDLELLALEELVVAIEVRSQAMGVLEVPLLLLSYLLVLLTPSTGRRIMF